MTKIISIAKNGKRYDMSENDLRKMKKQDFTKDEVRYRPSDSRGHSCEGCYNYYEDSQICEIVEGVIKSNWVCDEFERKYGD